MRIKHLSFNDEMVTAVMHGVKRSWKQDSSKVAMIVLGVSQSTVEAYVQNVLKTPGICDNILPASVTHPIDALKALGRKGTEHFVHVYLMDDLVYTNEAFSKPAFEGIIKTLLKQKPYNVYIYGDTKVADLFVDYGVEQWIESKDIHIGVENLMSNFSVPDFPDSESLGTQRPDNIETCSEFFIGDKYLSYTARSIMGLIDNIFNRCPKSNIRVTVSPKMARKLYRESMDY